MSSRMQRPFLKKVLREEDGRIALQRDVELERALDLRRGVVDPEIDLPPLVHDF